MKYFNGVSMAIGLTITGILCFAWNLFFGDNSLTLYSGILAIVVLVFAAGIKKVPPVHQENLQIFGRRTHIKFGEGWRWTPIIFGSAREETAQEKVFDVPIIKAIAKDRVEMELDVFIRWRVVDPSDFQRLEHGETDAKIFFQSNATEAGVEFIRENLSTQCLGCGADIQEKIQQRIKKEIERLGIEIRGVDVRSILPTEVVRKEMAARESKRIKTEAFADNMKRIREVTPDLTDAELTNTTQIVEGVVPKTIAEKTESFKLDIEPRILKLVAELFKKEG